MSDALVIVAAGSADTGAGSMCGVEIGVGSAGGGSVAVDGDDTGVFATDGSSGDNGADCAPLSTGSDVDGAEGCGSGWGSGCGVVCAGSDAGTDAVTGAGAGAGVVDRRGLYTSGASPGV